MSLVSRFGRASRVPNPIPIPIPIPISIPIPIPISTPTFVCYYIASLISNHVVSRDWTPIVVHAVHSILLGYCRLWNSCNFCRALW